MTRPACTIHGKASGFTLLELLLVLVLIGIGTGMAFMSTDRLAARAADRRLGDQTQHGLRQLRNKAILTATPVRGKLDFEHGTLSFSGRTIVSLPSQAKYRPTTDAAVSSSRSDAVLELTFFPDGTTNNAQFLLVAPSGAQELFRLEGISGRIGRNKVATKT